MIRLPLLEHDLFGKPVATFPDHAPRRVSGQRPSSRDDYRSRGINPSVSVCMKLTSASSSASDRPRFPTWLVFMLAVDSGAGQHVVPSPASSGWHRGKTSRVL